jgi:uncharacterized protein
MPTALVTGATSGLGAEFARQLAASGYDLVLVARDVERLAERREQLHDDHGVAVETLPADLTTDAGCSAVSDRICDSGHPIDLLVNNAAIGLYQPFGGPELVDEERQLDLNVRAVLRLCHAAVRAMTGRSSGRILNVSSVSAYVPRSTNASYGASKAWVSLFGESLALQLRGTGVTVTTVCPGFTHTEFHQRAGVDMSAIPERMWLDPPDVVREALAATLRGDLTIVPSRRYQAMVTASRVLPRGLVRRVVTRRDVR